MQNGHSNAISMLLLKGPRASLGLECKNSNPLGGSHSASLDIRPRQSCSGRPKEMRR